MLILTYISGLLLGLLIGMVIGRCVDFQDAPVVGSSHSVVTHMTTSNMTAEEFVMSDED